MDYTGILSSASRLKKHSLYRVTINETTREILLLLNTAISKAHDAGLSRIEYRLPINFQQVDESISNAEIQTAIYHNVVMELERKEYDVGIKFFKAYTLLLVSWTVKAEINDLERMKDKLMSIRR
jgi:hypothetical protein